MAKMAVENGARAIVCSPHEVAAIRSVVSRDIVLITPGVRPVGADVGDQSRVATPQEAIANGANIVVIGRPITGAIDIQKAAMEIAASL
jgi:orotidine-5'-phosphate decarboxylase